MSKKRLTVTVDPLVIRAGNTAVAAGQAESLSAWVNVALADRAAKDRRLRGLADAVAAYEMNFGVMTDEEIHAQARADGVAARVVRGDAPRRARPRRPRRRGAA